MRMTAWERERLMLPPQGSLPFVQNLSVYRGDTWSQTFRFLDADGQPHDLSGSTVVSEARPIKGGANIDLVTIAPNGTGEVTLKLPPEGLNPGDYEYDIEETKGTDVQTWVRGLLHIQRDVSNELLPA